MEEGQEICLFALVCPNHKCYNRNHQTTSEHCLLINPLKYKVPPFYKSNMSFEKYNELLMQYVIVLTILTTTQLFGDMQYFEELIREAHHSNLMNMH